MNSFYESGYVNYLRNEAGEVVRDKDGNPVTELPKMNPLLHAINMLIEQGYRRFVVCVENRGFIFGNEGLLANLQERIEKFHWVMTKKRLFYKDAEIDILYHGENQDIIRLRGPMYDAAIVQGKCSDDFDTLLSFCLRLGDYPVKVRLK